MDEVAWTIRRAVPSDADLAARTFRDTFGAGHCTEDVAARVARSFGPAR